MKKYLQIFKISFEQEFTYRLNFIMWRVRNILQIFLVFFLWDSVFSSSNTVLFGYDRTRILTYVFGLLVVRAIVLSARSVDIAGEISQGLLTNYLLKPLSYFKYWFTRDMASKALNLIFAAAEITLLYFILKPEFYFQTNLITLGLFLTSIILAILLFFLLLTLFNLFPLWFPEQAWGPTFFLMIFMDFMGGGVFPLDILPGYIQQALYLTPFPYLMFIPIEIYLDKLAFAEVVKSLIIAGTWVTILLYVVNLTWRRGLRVYRAEGR